MPFLKQKPGVSVQEFRKLPEKELPGIQKTMVNPILLVSIVNVEGRKKR
jgi:hypothetical protein